MEGCSKKSEKYPHLLDLIPREREKLVKRTDEESSSELIKKLELRLAPPCQEWPLNEKNKHVTTMASAKSLLSLGSSSWFTQQQQAKAATATTTTTTSFLQFPSITVTNNSQSLLPVMLKESSQHCRTKVIVNFQKSAEKNTLSQSAPPPPDNNNNTAVHISSQKRTAPGPVVGWPPIRSFRKNLASSSSSKPATDSQNQSLNKKIAVENPVETCKKGVFVKINMDGVPIGRKVNLKSYDSYEKLSTAVDDLFRGLLAAQRDSSAGDKQEEEKLMAGILDGSGEYTLVYEDNEGDSMLVGDVPWHMFVSTVKRLRVIKSSEVPALSRK